MLFSPEELQRMKQVDIKEAVPETLVDISSIEIDMKKTVSTRIADYVQKVNNPFLVRVGEYVVKIGYSDCKETINERMEHYIEKLSKIK